MAAELKDLRVQAGLTTRAVAARVGFSSAGLNRSELGKRVPSLEEVGALLAVYSVVGKKRARILELTRAANTPGWWETGDLPRQVQLPALITFESQATRIVNFGPLLIPGLLQTHNYIRAVMRYGGIPEADAEVRIATRVRRQTVLTKSRGPSYLAILDEAALRRPIGGSLVMADQIRKLIEMSELPNVTIRAIPFRRGGYLAAGGFSLLNFSKATPIVFLDQRKVGAFLHKPDDTCAYQHYTDTMLKIALSAEESVDFLARMATDHERG
ncbi:Helix-turn-helix domain-containing protein [Actinokineospora alba]|uniref:Helix-turn-helix domain-containing protein n=1 Tax=Actinokineospora alba TaxID=504798 RepID=A0A1H0Q333_9PSEU|nr:helix-turn-helix transcriptional regulator [Actinokineospora alba]TDP66028.1 helix-turn-helix protein [Actinokineospora alba]SDI59629.1 Helix-turn-helix domain-containing protein [Actinokineospora alba]SDP11116.1 Helix-turn-helix domain-containing protein [Actinokineospora alba]